MSDDSQYKECEFCKNEIPILNLDLHGATCRRHHYKCPKCGEFVSLSGREEHEQMNHSLERCEKCGTSYKPIDRETHVSVCRYGNITCEYCDSGVIRKEFVEHQEACGARTERCENCGKYVMLKDTQMHICRPASPPNFTERIGTMFGSNLEPNQYTDLPFSNPYAIPRDTAHNDTIRRAVPLHMTPSPLEPPTFVSLSPLESRLPRDEDSNSTGVPLEFEPNPTGPCEFCGNQLPLLALDGHQEMCKYRVYTTGTETKYCTVCKQMVPESEIEEHSLTCMPRTKPEKFNQTIGSHYTRRSKLEPKPEPRLDPKQELRSDPKPELTPELTPEHSSSMIPCEFCEQMCEFSEISTHQEICPNRNTPLEFGHISPPMLPFSEPRVVCRFCHKYFERHEIGSHRIYCTSNPQTETETETKCKYCLKKVSLEKVERHQRKCSKNSEQTARKKCIWCLEHFATEMISDHENTCSYRNVKGRRGIHDTELSLELPFSDTKPSLKIEQEKIGTIDNKCPFCRFPRPAFDMENHKNICAKNPRFRSTSPFDMSPTPDELIKSSNPELGISSRPEPKPEPNKSKLRMHEKAPKYETETLKNPFSKEPPDIRTFLNTHRTMDDNSRNLSDSKYPNKHEPFKTTTTTTTTTTTNNTNSNPYSLYSNRNPSPKQTYTDKRQFADKLTLYKDKQQQTDATKSPILPLSPNELFQPKNEREQQQHTHKQQQQQYTDKQYEYTGKQQIGRQQIQTTKQQQTETKSPIFPSHRRDLLSPTELFQRKNEREQQQIQTAKQQQYTHKQQQNDTVSPVFSPQRSPIELFQRKNEREPQYTHKQQQYTHKQQQYTHKQQQYTGKQQQSDAVSPVFSSQRSPIEQFQRKNEREQQYTHKQQQQQIQTGKRQQNNAINPVLSSQRSPTELFRGKNDKELAFTNMTPDKNSLIFLPPKQFKCELKPSTVPLTNSSLPSRYKKPDSIILPDAPGDKKHHLTPTQDTQMLFPLESHKQRFGTTPSSSFPTAHYTDTNTSYKPEPTHHNPRYTSPKPELTRKESPGQSKYPRRTSPRTGELDYQRADKYSDSNRPKASNYIPKDRTAAARDIFYPPDYQRGDSYPRTSSTGTETIVDPPPNISTQKRTHDVAQRYKQTNNYYHTKMP